MIDLLNDLDWDERQSSEHARKVRKSKGLNYTHGIGVVRLPGKIVVGQPKTNFCPECGEYVNQNHEHGA